MGKRSVTGCEESETIRVFADDNGKGPLGDLARMSSSQRVCRGNATSVLEEVDGELLC